MNFKVGQVYYLENKDCYWICFQVTEKIKFGRTSIMKKPSLLEAELGLGSKSDNSVDIKVNDDLTVSFGLDNIYNFTQETIEDPLFEKYTKLVNKIDEDTFNDFYQKIVKYEYSKPRKSKEKA